jgi:hypothetical protein
MDSSRQLHDTLDFIGLRAQATTVGLLQLCTELVQAEVIDLDAIDRIKAAVHRELLVSHPRGHDREEFARTLQERLDAVFPHDEAEHRATSVGAVDMLRSSLDPQG